MPLYSEHQKEDIRRANPVPEVAVRLGLEIRNRRMRCPWHGGADFNVALYPTSAHCFSRCGRHYDVFDLVQQVRGCDFRMAIDYLAAFTPGLGSPAGERPFLLPSHVLAAPPPSSQMPHQTYTPPPGDVMRLLDLAMHAAHERVWQCPEALAYLRGRGVTDAQIRAHRIGYSPSPDFLGDVIPTAQHPLAREVGLLGSDGRDRYAWRVMHFEVRRFWSQRIGALVERPVWMSGRLIVPVPASQKGWTPKSLGLSISPMPLLGYQCALDRGPAIVAVEGIFDLYAAERLGYPAVAYGCNQPGEPACTEVRQLLRTARIVAVPDRDTAGRSGAISTIRKLAPCPSACIVVVRIPPRYKDLDEFACSADDAQALFGHLLSAALLSQRRRAASRSAPRLRAWDDPILIHRRSVRHHRAAAQHGHALHAAVSASVGR